MKSIGKMIPALILLTALAGAQTSAGNSTSASSSVTPGQAGASGGTRDNVQAGGTSASVSGSTSAQASGPQQNKNSDQGKHERGAAKSQASDPSALSLASGTTLQAELSKPVDAKKAKPGDPVAARLTEDVKADGKVVLRKGSKLFGHVTEAQARSKEQSQSKLGIVFDKAQLKGGQEASISAVIEALAPPVQSSVVAGGGDNLSAPMGGAAPHSSAGGGGLVGGVVGGTSSTVGGATGAVTNPAGGVAGGLNSTVSSTAGAATGGLNAQGALSSTSRGVVGLEGLTLGSASSAQGSVITSLTRNVKLDSGTQMVLQVSRAATK